jgi:hypothetical protein
MQLILLLVFLVGSPDRASLSYGPTESLSCRLGASSQEFPAWSLSCYERDTALTVIALCISLRHREAQTHQTRE